MAESRDPREFKIWKSALWNVLFFGGALLVLFVLGRVSGVPLPERQVPYSELEQVLIDGRVDHVVISDQQVTAYLKKPDAQGANSLSAERVEPDLAAQFSQYHVPFSRVHSSNTLQLVWSLLAPG